jgi:hypothetical protein
VAFLKDNPKFKAEMMIHCIISCSGELIRCEVDKTSGEPTLDTQVLCVFQSLKKWTPGKLNAKTVDCSVLFSIAVKKGAITLS